MTLRILTYDELPRERMAEQAGVQIAAFGGFWTPSVVRAYRRSGSRLSEYVGVYAVDDGVLVGQILVFRVPYRFPDGSTAPVAGLAAVTTRPDAMRRGVARALLDDVHRRERVAGITDALLWTNRSWVAYRLYETAGYRTLYSPGWALRVCRGRQALPPGWSLTPGNRTVLDEVESLHTQRSGDRIGFAARSPGTLRADARAGDVQPSNLLVLRHDGRLEGYAYAARETGILRCGELVTASPAADSMLLQGLESRAAGGLLAVGYTGQTDRREELSRRGYIVAPGSWWVLMGALLDPHLDPARAPIRFGADDPRFVCMALDRF